MSIHRKLIMSKMSFNANKNSKKPYCKVCHDAGKPESEYTNHWVKSLPDRTGKTTVTCPTLLSNECRYCFKLGHTAKFCPVIEQNKKRQEKNERRVAFKEEEPKKVKKVKKSVSNIFSALHEDSESETEEIKVSNLPDIVVEEFPALGAPLKTLVRVQLPSVKQEVKSGWTDALAKPKQQKVEISMPIISAKKDLTKEIYTRNWADWSDSDTDEEELPEVKKQSVNYDSDW